MTNDMIVRQKVTDLTRFQTTFDRLDPDREAAGLTASCHEMSHGAGMDMQVGIPLDRPLWVISGHRGSEELCPLCARSRHACLSSQAAFASQIPRTGVSKHGLEKCCSVANATAPIKRGGQSLSQAQDGLEPRNSKRDLTMKTLLAVALAAAALTIGTATLAPISSTAVADGGGPDKWCGAAVCPPTQAPSGIHLGQ
jgi:hypothetical protein